MEKTSSQKHQLHVAVADAETAKIERRAYIALKPETRLGQACEELARYVSIGTVGRNVIVGDPVFASVKQESISSSLSKTVHHAAWLTTGGALALGIGGSVVAIQESQAGACAIAAATLFIIDMALDKPS